MTPWPLRDNSIHERIGNIGGGAYAECLRQDWAQETPTSRFLFYVPDASDYLVKA
jgi:hypothetical protein